MTLIRSLLCFGRSRWTASVATTYAELPAAAFARFDKGAEVMLHLGGGDTASG
jgi:hypothetical protein